MSELNDDFKEMRREVEDKRMIYAERQLSGFHIRRKSSAFHIYTTHGEIVFWPYTGWYQGKKPLGRVKGRGIKKLLKILIQELPKLRSK